MSDVDIAAFATEGNRDLHILYGSQSGNSEGLAEKWQKEAAKYGLTPTVHDMDGFDINSMSGMSRVMIVCSTWGEGEMPDNAEELYEAAVGVGKILTNTHFSICALGDTGYDLFCQSGKDWDKTMEDMGGTRIHDRVDCDVDFEDPAELWMNGTMSKLACVDSDGAFQADLVDSMASYSSGAVIESEAETIVDEKTGFLFKSGEAKSLSQKIIQVLTMDESILKMMGIVGRKNIMKKFNVEKMCFSTYSEYKRLLN